MQATVHSRPAQASRAWRPMSSGSRAAATRSQLSTVSPVGPTAKRTSAPQPGWLTADPARPKTDSAPCPAANVPSTQGAETTAATTVAPRATHRARSAPSAWPTT